MNKSKVVSLLKNSLIALFLMMGITASAQHKTAEEKAKSLTDTMSARLSLNEEQYKKVYDVNVSFVTKTSALKKETGDRSTKISEIKSINTERDSALKSVLTNEQYTQYKEFKKENRKNMKGLRKKG